MQPIRSTLRNIQRGDGVPRVSDLGEAGLYDIGRYCWGGPALSFVIGRICRRRSRRLAQPYRLCLVLSALLVAMSGGPVQAQNSIPPPQIVPPLTGPQAQYFQQNPQELQQLRDRLSQQAGQQPLAVRKLAPAETPSAGSWTTLTNSPGVTLQNALLLTDGTVIASQECTGNWYRLTPDQTGGYINGTWSQIASLPSGYAPLFHGSGVLPDGRVIIEGGEYNGVSGNCGSPVLTSKGRHLRPGRQRLDLGIPAERLVANRGRRIGHPRQRHFHAVQLLRQHCRKLCRSLAQCDEFDLDGDRHQQSRQI